MYVIHALGVWSPHHGSFLCDKNPGSALRGHMVLLGGEGGPGVSVFTQGKQTPPSWNPPLMPDGDGCHSLTQR